MSKKIAIKIFYDEYTGEVNEIKSTKRFSDEGFLFRIDVLKDTITALENIYQYERSQYFMEINDIGEA